MGLLGGFFVPLYEFHLTPKTVEHMVHNTWIYLYSLWIRFLQFSNSLTVLEFYLLIFSNCSNMRTNVVLFTLQVDNVSFSFELMQDVGLPKPKARAEDIVNMDLKSTLRVLYSLFTKYRNVA